MTVARGTASAHPRAGGPWEAGAGCPWEAGAGGPWVAGAGGTGHASEKAEARSDASEGTEGFSEAGGDGASTSFCNDPTAEPPPATTPGERGEKRGRTGEGEGGGTVTHSLVYRLTTVCLSNAKTHKLYSNTKLCESTMEIVII
ncbi:jg7587 [Pararge aegeria aegeria]|uniref:Jg7587 protein n=1 Tax=Pararge aegeria aegeria TaxID=348720 RepID=A0A8S4RZI1_9NEOP|nr:jg7587 [Pararge aegeria aegeria]